MANPLDLTDQNISFTYQRILQTDSGFFYDGLGNTVSIGVGLQGWQGPRGDIGIYGPQGWQGPEGFQGFQGWQGNIGNTGAGAQGFQGFQGLSGTDGPQGFQGFNGPQGFQGSSGSAGQRGGLLYTVIASNTIPGTGQITFIQSEGEYCGFYISKTTTNGESVADFLDYILLPFPATNNVTRNVASNPPRINMQSGFTGSYFFTTDISYITPQSTYYEYDFGGQSFDLPSIGSQLILNFIKPGPTGPAGPAGAISVLKSTTDTAGYTGTANTAVYTQLIAANTYAIGDIIRVTYRTRKTGTSGTQTLRIYVNTTANLSGSPILIGGFANSGAISFLTNQMVRHLVIKSSTNNTEVYLATGTGVSTDFGLYNGVTTCAIDWTTIKYFVFAIQQTSLSDVNFGSMYLIEKL